MDGKPRRIRQVPLNLSLADLYSLLRTKVVSIGEHYFLKSVEVIHKNRLPF